MTAGEVYYGGFKSTMHFDGNPYACIYVGQPPRSKPLTKARAERLAIMRRRRYPEMNVRIAEHKLDGKSIYAVYERPGKKGTIKMHGRLPSWWGRDTPRRRRS